MSRTSLAEFVQQLDGCGDQDAWVHHRGYRTERWTYRRTTLVARQFARELEARGVQRGDRVLLWGENCAEWVAAFLGCILRGAVAVPMDRTAAPEFALRVACETRARLIVAGRDLLPFLSSTSFLLLDELSQSLSHHGDGPYSPPPLARADLAQLIFTSGTTAEPKGVAISHGNLLANLEPLETAIQPYRKYEWLVHPLRFLDLLPLSHVFGQFMGIWVPPLLGGTVFFHDTLNPSEVTRLVRRERVSVLIAVPRMLESLRARVERTEEAAGRSGRFLRDLEWAAAPGVHFARRWWRFRRVHNEIGWKFWAFICGGAALASETEEFWRRLSFVVIQGYGLTETTSLISVNHPFQLSRGSIGKVLPGRELRLSESGEILVRGENIASGYWQSGEFQAAAEGGWFHTGDVGALDAAGNLYFKGRQKNVIVTPEGMNVYPEDLEAALRAQPEVRDCAVVALPREKNAEACAVLLLRPAKAPLGLAAATPESLAADAVRRANQALSAHQRIRHWQVWPDEDFPRTSTQKPRTNLILERILAQERAAAAPAAGPLAELVARVSGRAPQALPPGASLDRDLGLNSLERVELISAIEDRYQTELSESSVTEATTVGDLGRLLDETPVPSPAYVYPAWTQQSWQQAIRVGVYYLFVWTVTHLLAHPRVRGREHLRGVRGPVLVISNHITEIDIGFILAALPPRLRHRLAVAMLGERLRNMRNPLPSTGFFRRWLDRLEYFLVVALFNVFPLPEHSGYRQSFAYAGASADRGYGVLIFPEGRRTPDGDLSPFRAGIGLLAKRMSLPVVPVRIDGLYELARAGRRIAPPGAIRVSLGAPLRFAPEDSEESIVQRLERIVTDLEWKVV